MRGGGAGGGGGGVSGCVLGGGFFGVRLRVVTPCFYSRNIYNSLGKVADKLQHDSEF